MLRVARSRWICVIHERGCGNNNNNNNNNNNEWYYSECWQDKKANVREFADENDNTDDYGESKRGYTHREEEEAVEEIRTSSFSSSSSSSSKNKRRAKQKEILKTINGHAKMLPDKSPSRVYDIFTDDDEFEDSNTASSSCKTQFTISDVFKNANSNGIGIRDMHDARRC